MLCSYPTPLYDVIPTVEKEGAIAALESEIQGLKSILLERKEEIELYKEKERVMINNDDIELKSMALQLDAARLELQSTEEKLSILGEEYATHREQLENDLLTLKESSAQELLFLENVLQESKEKSKIMRSQLDGLGAAIESATSALKLSESTLEDRDRALGDAQAAQQLYEVIKVTAEKQCAALKNENLQLQLLLEQSIQELEEVRGQLTNIHFNMDLDMNKCKDGDAADVEENSIEMNENVDKDISITSASAPSFAPASTSAFSADAAAVEIKELHSEVDKKAAVNDRLEVQISALIIELQDEKKRAAATKVQCGATPLLPSFLILSVSSFIPSFFSPSPLFSTIFVFCFILTLKF